MMTPSPNVDDREIARAYFGFCAALEDPRRAVRLGAAKHEWAADAVRTRIDRAWLPLDMLDALVSEATSDEEVALVGAGPLEDLIRRYPEFDEAIADRCATDSRWRQAVSSVWVPRERLDGLPAALSALVLPTGTGEPRKRASQRKASERDSLSLVSEMPLREYAVRYLEAASVVADDNVRLSVVGKRLSEMADLQRRLADPTVTMDVAAALVEAAARPQHLDWIAEELAGFIARRSDTWAPLAALCEGHEAWWDLVVRLRVPASVAAAMPDTLRQLVIVDDSSV